MYLSLCLIAKNENSYLKEWLDYHILFGVEHFWVYDNDSTTPLTKSLKKYIDKGWVTVNGIHGPAMQLFAYDHCLKTYGALSQWIGFIDTDEFLVVKSGASLPDFLKDYESYGGLTVSSLFFGSGGQKKRPRCGQIAAYLLRTPSSFIRNRLVKSIVQPSKTMYPLSPHSFMHSEGNYSVNELKFRVDDQLFPVHVSEIQLNHYYTRSHEEMDEKKNRGRGDGGKAYAQKNWDDTINCSTVHDTLILDLAVKRAGFPPSLSRNYTVLTDPLSTTFLEGLSSAADKLQPVKYDVPSFDSVEKQPDMEKFLAKHMLSMEYISENKIREARDLLVELIHEFPYELINYTNFASACINLGDLPPAWEALSKAWKIHPRDLLVLKCMVEYFYAIKNYDQMEKCAILMFDYGDLDPRFMAGLIVAQWKLGKIPEATANAEALWPLLNPDMLEEHIWYKELIEFYPPEKIKKI